MLLIYNANIDTVTNGIVNDGYILVKEDKIKDWLIRLSDKGPDTVIITSVPEMNRKKTAVVAFNREDKRFWKVNCDYIPTDFPGTGDAFASVVVGSMLRGDSLPIALDRGVQFISTAIRATYGYKYPEREGIMVERVLDNLNSPVLSSSYEIF